MQDVCFFIILVRLYLDIFICQICEIYQKTKCANYTKNLYFCFFNSSVKGCQISKDSDSHSRMLSTGQSKDIIDKIYQKN